MNIDELLLFNKT